MRSSPRSCIERPRKFLNTREIARAWLEQMSSRRKRTVYHDVQHIEAFFLNSLLLFMVHGTNTGFFCLFVFCYSGAYCISCKRKGSYILWVCAPIIAYICTGPLRRVTKHVKNGLSWRIIAFHCHYFSTVIGPLVTSCSHLTASRKYEMTFLAIEKMNMKRDRNLDWMDFTKNWICRMWSGTH